MATYVVNPEAVAHARKLIDARQYVLTSDWGERQPKADAENAFLTAHFWAEYASWHLALTEGATDETKARYAFVYGDFRRVHRTALIACVYRAAEWRHKAVELPPLVAAGSTPGSGVNYDPIAYQAWGERSKLSPGVLSVRRAWG